MAKPAPTPDAQVAGAKPAPVRSNFSGMAQFALLVSLYPILLNFGLLQLWESAPNIEIFEFSAQGAGGSGLGRMLEGIFDDLEIVFIYLFQVLFFPFALIACLWRRRWGWLVFGLAVPLAILMSGIFTTIELPGWNLELQEWVISAVAANVAFIWFALRGRIASVSFAIFAVLCVLLTYLLSADSGLGPFIIVQAFTPLAAFLMTTLLVRLIVLAARQNAYIPRELGWLRTLGLILRTALLWTPILILAVPYFTITELTRQAVRDYAYTQPQMVQYGPERELRTDVMFSISRYFEAQHDAWNSRGGELRAKLELAPVDQMSDWAGLHFDDIITPTLNQIPPDFTGFLADAKNWSVEQSQDVVEKAYSYVRSKARASIVAKVDALEPLVLAGQMTTGEAARSVQEFGANALVEASREAQNAVWWIFAYGEAAELLVHSLFVILCLKSFMYVFGRLAFTRRDGSYVTLADPDQTDAMPDGQITVFGSTYDVPDTEDVVFYSARRFQPHGRPPRFAMPKPLRAPIARLLHGSMAMNKMIIPKGDGPVRFTATGGAEFVEWLLEEGETVVFNFRDFVGMTEATKISTLISARVSTLVFGHFIFSTATGPGKLVLLTRGKPYAGGVPARLESMPPNRLIAWHKTARFNIDSELQMVDIYLSNAYVRPIGQSRLILDVDRQDVAGSGLMRFVRNFLWPG